MASNDSPTPDLATILATLAGFAPQKQQTQQTVSSQSIPPILQSQPAPQNQQFQQPPPYVAQQPPHQWQYPPQNYPIPRSSTPVDAPKVRLIDPATIIDWSSGLKCVMRTVAKQESILHDIRRVSYLLFYFSYWKELTSFRWSSPSMSMSNSGGMVVWIWSNDRRQGKKGRRS